MAKCKACNGSGQVEEDDYCGRVVMQCHICNGTGKATKAKQQEYGWFKKENKQQVIMSKKQNELLAEIKLGLEQIKVLREALEEVDKQLDFGNLVYAKAEIKQALAQADKIAGV